MTTKKTAAKAVPAKKVSVKPTAKKAPKAPTPVTKPEQQFNMPVEVSNWIDQAMSRLHHMQNKIDEQAKRIKELESYRKWAEHRILGSSHE